MNIIELRDELNQRIDAEDVELDAPINFWHGDECLELADIQINIESSCVNPLRINLR